MTQSFISAICVTFGRSTLVDSALACFLAQDYKGPKELIILNTCPKQTFLGELPDVRIINLQERPKTLGEARNMAIEAARGQFCITWDDDDYCLPNHLSNYARNFTEGVHWVHFNKEFYCENYTIKGIVPGQCPMFAFSKEAWKAVGGYPAMTVGEDRGFISKVTEQFNGKKVELQDDELSYIYRWQNGMIHASAIPDSTCRDRVEQDFVSRVGRKLEPTGNITLKPDYLDLNPSEMVKLFFQKNPPSAKKNAVAIVQLGRFGDIINILPIARNIFLTTGQKPYIVVSREFESVLDGVWYAVAYPVAFPFHQLNEAMLLAGNSFKTVIRCQIFGKGWNQTKLTESFCKDSWREGGALEHFHDREWPLVFDKRDAKRESALLKKLFLTTKPKIVVNLTRASTASFARGHEVLEALRHMFGQTYEVVSIGDNNLERIYDLVTIIEKAEVFVSIDTATLHLAAATSVPVVAIVRTGWEGSIPRFNCATRILYEHGTPEFICSAVGNALHWKHNKTMTITMSTPTRKLPNVTLWACCWSEDRNMYNQTVRVLRYCSKLFQFERIVFFAYLPPPGPMDFALDLIQIPKLDMAQFSLFHTKTIPLLVHSDFALSVHEDGFPLDAALWRDEFLAYDYIGAPWNEGDVGNGGFCIESRRLMQAKLNLPFMMPPIQASDTFVCRTHKSTLEALGLKFAPVDVAVEFSTEQTGRQWPSFGFHGRRDQPEKYTAGWNLIDASEK